MPKTLTPEEAKALNQKLVRAFESMQTKYHFKPKQIVRWKRGLKNKGLPEYDEPAIVWEILDPPRFDNEHSAGTPYFYEPLDIVLAIMDEDDDFVLFHFDSRRFEPMPL